jgi:hypothetical protein
MRKALFFVVIVFLFLHVTTYSLRSKDAFHSDFQGSHVEFSAGGNIDVLHHASSNRGVFPFFGDCAPQPASVCLLTLCSLVLFNRRNRTPRPEIY